MLSLVGDYGSSSDDEEEDDVRGAPDDDAGKRITAIPRDTSTTTTMGAQNHRNDLAPSTSARASVLPNASALFESSVSGVWSGGTRFTPGAQVVEHQRGSQITGNKRAASGQLPISDVVQKSSRAGQQKNVSAKPVNTLLPPQLRGRSNNATQDLEALGFTNKPKQPRRA